MKGACAIVFDTDKAFISFATFKRTQLNFLKEYDFSLPPEGGGGILDCLRNNSEILGQKITEAEKRYSFCVKKVFVQLPWGFANTIKICEPIPLKWEKIIKPRDIILAKKYLENKFLDWDDFCLHNIIIGYKVDEVNYDQAPLGLRAKKIELKVLLIWIKDRVHKEAEDIFGSLDKKFAGFIAPSVSSYSCAFSKREKIQSVINIGYQKSCFIISSNNDYIDGEINFSLKRTIEEMGRRFTLPISVASEVFNRYISFKEVPYFKEITIKRHDGYLNLGLQALNSFVKDYIKGEISELIQQIKDKSSDSDYLISFIGRLNSKEGFFGFLQGCRPYGLKVPYPALVSSSSFGCLSYGLSRFLENDYGQKGSFWQRMVKIYKEYF